MNAYDETLRRLVEAKAPGARVDVVNNPMSLDVRVTIYPAPRLCPRLFVSEVFDAARLPIMSYVLSFIDGLLEKLSNANYFEPK